MLFRSYFPGVYHFDEAEVNEILMAALSTRECLRAIKNIERRNRVEESHTDEILKRVEAGRVAESLPNTVAAIEGVTEEQSAIKGAYQKRDGGDDNG